MRYLSDEVWSNVFEALHYSLEVSDFVRRGYWGGAELEGLTALSRLCRTSSRFRRLAQPALYRTLPAGHWKIRDSLAATLRRHSQLAQYVVNIDLGDGMLSRDEFAALVSPPSLGVIQQYPWIPETCRPQLQDPSDASDYSAQLADAWFTVYVSVLPNLELLELTMRNGCRLLLSLVREVAKQNAWQLSLDAQDANAQGSQSQSVETLETDSTLMRPNLSSRPLSRLEELRVTYYDTEYALQLAPIQDLFLLPQLTTFRGYAVDLDTTFTTVGNNNVSPHSKLRHVYLEASLADADGIRNLLRACPCLETLSIHWGDATIGVSMLDFELIGNALRECGTNLETFDLDCRSCLAYTSGDWSGKIGDIQSLERLKNLSLPQDVLLGSEDELLKMDNVGDDSDSDGEEAEFDLESVSLEPLLPDSLETLRLYSCFDDKQWVQSGIQGVLVTERLAQLKRLQLDIEATLSLNVDEAGWQRNILQPGWHLIRSTKL